MRKYEPRIMQIFRLNHGGNCHSLILILILMPIKTRIDNVFGQKIQTRQNTTEQNTNCQNTNVTKYTCKKIQMEQNTDRAKCKNSKIQKDKIRIAKIQV